MKKSTIAALTAGIAGSALLAAGILSGLRFNQDVHRARERLANLDRQVAQTPCGPVEYTVWGEGQPVLVLHGNGGGFDQGLGLAQSYLDQGFQVIAPSRFGYLGSPAPEGATVAMQAEAYACLLDALGVDRAAVFANSAGVTSAVQFALGHPERVSALVLHSPNAPGEAGLAAPPKPVFSALVHSDFAWWALSTYFRPLMQTLIGVPEGFPLTPQFQAEIQGVLENCLPVRPRGDGVVFDTFVSNPEINTYSLGEVRAPTLVVSAVDDPMALHSGARRLADEIPNARLVAVPDGGHLMLGQTEAVRAEVTRFLGAILAQAGSAAALPAPETLPGIGD